MCCTRLTGNAGCKNGAKNRHLRTIAQLYRHLRHIATVGKNMLNSNMSSTCPHNMANFGPLTAEICWRVWGAPANFNTFRVLPSLLQRWHSPEASQTSRDVWPSPELVHHIYIFGGSCPLTEFCPVRYSLYVQVLHSPILAALLHGTPAARISQTLQHGTMNGITELSQRAPPIFGRAAITLAIGPRSSFFFLSLPNLSGGRLDVYHTSTHGVVLVQI